MDAKTTSYFRQRRGLSGKLEIKRDGFVALLGAVLGALVPSSLTQMHPAAFAVITAVLAVVLFELVAYLWRFIWIAPKQIYFEQQNLVVLIERDLEKARNELATREPKIKASLFIDAIKEGFVHYRILIRNDGHDTDQLVVRSKTKLATHVQEEHPMRMMLPANGHLSVTSAPFMVPSGESESVLVEVGYDANSAGARRTSVFRFSITPYVQSQTGIDPENWDVRDGDPYAASTAKDILAKFAGPDGTMIFPWFEINDDGSMNSVVFVGGSKTLHLDPIARIASLTIARDTKRSLRLDVPKSRPMAHIVAVTWNSAGGATISVDGAAAAIEPENNQS